MKNSLESKGLSLSQASSISNLCNQRALEINHILTNVNNYKKTVTINGHNHLIVAGKPLPSNVVELLSEKSELHACQAFLMENIKAKDNMITNLSKGVCDVSSIEKPEKPEFKVASILSQVDESFGWEQLTVSEYAEYLEAEAYASHFGQFFHKGSTLDALRKEIPGIPSIEWMNIKDGEKSPVSIHVHHKSEDLLVLHESLAEIHRKYEQRVNYYKAKVKNAVTAENARIANINADAQAEVERENEVHRTEYENDVKKYMASVQGLKLIFEKDRQEKIKSAATLRINVHPRFQKVVDMFLKNLPESQE